MPPKGYKLVSIREDVYRKIEEFKSSNNLPSISDAIDMLLRYRDIHSAIKSLIGSSQTNNTETLAEIMNKLNAIERMLDLIHINISELYRACTRRRRIPNSQRTLDESVEKNSTSSEHNTSDVWKGFKEEALKLFEDIYNEYMESKRKSKS